MFFVIMLSYLFEIDHGGDLKENGGFQERKRVAAECFSLSCSVISLKSIIGRSLVDFNEISEQLGGDLKENC